MDELVNLLIERETIEGPDFRAVVERAGDLGKADVEAAQVGHFGVSRLGFHCSRARTNISGCF